MKILACTLLLFLSGCGLTPAGDAFRAGAIDVAQRAADGGVLNARDYLCEGATIGSIRRAFGSSQSAVDAYNRLCSMTLVSVLDAPQK